MDKISVAQQSGTGLELNGRFFSWLWLRDHSQDFPAYHQGARQRLVETSALDEVPSAEVTIEGERIALTWADGATAGYTAEYLEAVGEPQIVYPTRHFVAEPWEAVGADQRTLRVEFDDFVHSDASLYCVLEALGTVGFAFVGSVPLHRDATRHVFERIGYVRKTLFGELWNLRSDGEFDDTGSTQLDISPHTDGTYSNDAPGFLGLHCLSFNAEGGNNILVDGFHLAEQLRASNSAAFDTLSSVEIPGRYIGDGGHLVARRPLFRHEAGQLTQVSYNNHDRAPFWLPEEEMSDFYRSLAVFETAVGDPLNRFEFALPPGTMTIFDNWRLLHGRNAFEGDRHLIGGYLNREDYESMLRRLAPQPLDMVS